MPYARPSVITSALLAGGLGLAGMVPMASASAPAPGTGHPLPHQAVVAHRLSLSQAIDAAEAAVPGRAIDAQLDTDAGIAHYEIEIITPQYNRVEVHVNANTGVALLHKDHGPASPRDKHLLETSKLTLKQALGTALRHTPGTALEADLGQEAGRAVFEVDVLTASGQRVQVQLNAADGSLLHTQVD